MRLFGLQITKAPAKGRSRLISNLLFPWAYGSNLHPESDYEAFMKAFRGWVYVCSTKNAVSSASIPLRLYAGKPNTAPIKNFPTRKVPKEREAYIRSGPCTANLKQVKGAVEIEEIIDHPLTALMRNVNNFMNRFSLFESTHMYLELCGNSFWYIVKDRLGVPREIWLMPPQNMRIVPHPVNFIKGYNYVRGFDEIFFKEEDVIHFKYPSPTSLYYGRGPLAAVTDAYNISQNINKYENNVFANMGRIEGAFETDNELSQYEFERLKEEIKATFQGIENVGKSPLLEKGVHYKPYGLSPKDLAFLQGRKAIKEEIVNAYGQSLGLYDKDATRANAEVASFTHMKDTIKPRLVRMEEKLNEKLTPQFDPNLFVAFDDPVPLDKDHRLREKELHLKTGYSSINIERAEDNKEPVEWGDEPILDRKLVPFSERESVMQEPEDVPSEDNDEEMMMLAGEILQRLIKADGKIALESTDAG